MFRLFALFVFIFFISEPAVAEEAVKISIHKAARTMTILDGKGTILKSYKIALGAQPVGAKQQEGDEKTPEGLYKISEKKENSHFHKALRISYPEIKDVENAKKLGVAPGGDIMIHGIRNGFGWIGKWHLLYDRWTDGCAAVTNSEIDEIWSLVSLGTPVEIKP